MLMFFKMKQDQSLKTLLWKFKLKFQEFFRYLERRRTWVTSYLYMTYARRVLLWAARRVISPEDLETNLDIPATSYIAYTSPTWMLNPPGSTWEFGAFDRSLHRILHKYYLSDTITAMKKSVGTFVRSPVMVKGVLLMSYVPMLSYPVYYTNI
ncbi:hypothetical protein BJ165DRAFT_695051 [Panaeolus papilionaceus]|nr:hypothetical protein BJ165DRAFT_695051 [Panaeolus papilionaceus]